MKRKYYDTVTICFSKVTLIACRLPMTMGSFGWIFGVIRNLIIFDLKWSWPVEKIRKIHENHDGKNDADDDTNHHIHGVMTVVFDPG